MKEKIVNFLYTAGLMVGIIVVEIIQKIESWKEKNK